MLCDTILKYICLIRLGLEEVRMFIDVSIWLYVLILKS